MATDSTLNVCPLCSRLFSEHTIFQLRLCAANVDSLPERLRLIDKLTKAATNG